MALLGGQVPLGPGTGEGVTGGVPQGFLWKKTLGRIWNGGERLREMAQGQIIWCQAYGRFRAMGRLGNKDGPS